LCLAIIGGSAAFATLESVPAADDSEAVPRVLSTADAEAYRRIFALGDSGDWKAVDTLIARLEDPVLVGPALAQRYLHPTKYRGIIYDLGTIRLRRVSYSANVSLSIRRCPCSMAPP